MSNSVLRIAVLVVLTYTTPNRLHGECEERTRKDVFASGLIYRMQINQSGIYRLDFEQLRELEGVSSTGVETRNMSLFGIKGGVLHHDSHHKDTERLHNIAFHAIDGGDGKINQASDYILFFATSSEIINLDTSSILYESHKNPFDHYNYVFLKINDTSPCSIRTEASNSIHENNSTNFYHFFETFEEDKVNLLDDFISTQGSGQEWYGDQINAQKDYNLLSKFKLPIAPLFDVHVQTAVASRSDIGEEVKLYSQDKKTNNFVRSVRTTDIEALYARKAKLELELQEIGSDEILNISVTQNSSQSKLWLDRATINGTTQLIWDNQQLIYNNIEAIVNSSQQLKIKNWNNQLFIWDITNPYQPIIKYIEKGLHLCNIDTINKYIVFHPDNAFKVNLVERVSNFNISNINSDFAIITNSAFIGAAERLKTHRENYSNISTTIIDIQNLYDYYSSGRQDPTAIRNFTRDLYHQTPNFASLLLIGDASFDYRYINKSLPRNHVIPTYETAISLDPLLAFPSDDYFALLDDGESGDLRGDLDIGVGRLTISTLQEANDVVTKIIHYDQENSTTGVWKTTTVFVADDEDNNLHINDADRIAQRVAARYPDLIPHKIYIDAFRQESTPGGNRYPEVTARLNQISSEGALVFNYLGHGGPNGWAQERILKVNDLNQWINMDRLPLIITATCSFAGFDDPGITSAGEAALLNPTGGALALFTTVRSVYASKNFQLTRSTFDFLFEKENGRYLTLGEIMRRAKNDNPSDNTNARKYFLIGDPTSQLSLPDKEIIVTKINNQEVTDSSRIRASALDEIHIQAQVISLDGKQDNDFDGKAVVTLYDKPSNIQTRANDQFSMIKTFESLQNILYHGTVEVHGGLLDFSIVLPVDMDYEIGIAKLTLYANNSSTGEAIGSSNHLYIGGSSTDPVVDNLPPQIDIYINDRTFQSGDRVGSHATAIIDLSDDYGINLSTVAIGHEIVAILDDDSQKTYILNDLFVGSATDARTGTIQFRLTDLEPGIHNLRVKAFDVANQSSEETVQFIVDENQNEQLTIQAFPNVISEDEKIDYTVSHHLPDGQVEVTIFVINSNGQLIQQNNRTLPSVNGTIKISMPFGDQPSGMYYHHFTLKSGADKKITAFGTKKILVL